MSADKKADYERYIFRTFVDDAGLYIEPESIQSMMPPHPDITCRTRTGEGLTFELVQVIDNGIARGVNDKIVLEKLFREACDDLPRDRSARLKRCLHNALIGVWFVEDDLRKAKKKAVIPEIISILEKVNITAEGVVPSTSYANLRHIVRRLMIKRGKFVGPCFNVDSSGSFGEPVVERVHEKFLKSYQTSESINPLAFYHLQPVSPDDLWLPKLHEFVTAKLGCSPFRRVWIYDAVERKVRYMYPFEEKEK